MKTMRSQRAFLLVFVLWLRGGSFARQLASLDNGRCYPSQQHLAVTGDPTELRISWKTDSQGCSNKVHFGKATDGVPTDNDLQSFEDGQESSYSAGDMCSSPARDYAYKPQYLHSAIFSRLEPGEKYWYRVHGSHEILTFQAPPPVDPSSGFSFLVFGDMGESKHKRAKSPGAADTVYWLKREVDEGADMIVHVGDISYANGDVKIWDTFMKSVEPMAQRVPYMVSVGNHEYDYDNKHHEQEDPSGVKRPYEPDWGNFGNDSGGECGVAFSMRFPMPSSPAISTRAALTMDNSRPNSPFWYSFDYGSVHFVSLSTEHDLRRDSTQYRWLKAELSAVDRCMTPWVIVLMHRPMYVVFPHKSNRVVADHLRNQVEDLLNAYEVDLVVSGHVHSYARTCNVLAEECVRESEGGMSHITVGCAGHKLSYVTRTQEDWLDHAEMEFGYGRVTVKDGHKLLFEYVVSKDGTVHDSLELKNHRAHRRSCDHLAANQLNATELAWE